MDTRVLKLVMIFVVVVCTSGRKCPQTQQYTEVREVTRKEPCQEKYTDSCGWWLTDECTFYRTAECERRVNETVTLERVVEVCCDGTTMTSDGACEPVEPDAAEVITTTHAPSVNVTAHANIRHPIHPNHELCSLKFDDIINGPDGRLYAFRGQKVYTFHADGVGVEHVHEDARDVFPGAPRNVRAAVYDLPNNKVYMFKGPRVWRYTGFSLDEGYPKHNMHDWYRGVDAALHDNSGRILLLKGDHVAEWREELHTPPGGSPLPLNSVWAGLRNNIEAAVNFKGVDYFFKGGRYFKYNSTISAVEPRRYKAGPWFGCGSFQPK